MTELRQRSHAQAQLMGDEFIETPVSWAGVVSLLEAAKRTVSRSFLCLGFILSQSVVSAELRGVKRGGKVLCRMCM